MQEVRDRLVLAALAHVPFEGWSRKALAEAAKDAGFDVTMGERAFPGGPVAAVEHFSQIADHALEAEAAAAGLEALRLSERIAWLVRRRIEPWAEHREAIRRAVALLALPANVAAALRATWRTVDGLWYVAGDDSADFSFYTKRSSLAAIYGATVLYWLEDNSDGFADSWAFLERRLADHKRLHTLTNKARDRLKMLPTPLRLVMGRRPPTRRFGLG